LWADAHHTRPDGRHTTPDGDTDALELEWSKKKFPAGQTRSRAATHRHTD